MDLDLFDYKLDTELIAQSPASPRTSARLLVYDRISDTITHTTVAHLPKFFPADSLMVVNKSKVIPARLKFRLPDKPKEAEILLHQNVNHTIWNALVSPGKYFRQGDKFRINANFPEWEILEILSGGERLIDTKLNYTELLGLLDKFGKMPLPPYIDKFKGKESEYQTPFGQVPGSVASPTDSLHFTP